ncbi:MAG TPA: CHAT domain-containing protein, partial [Ignavibacteria bacterium]|nr:CHAT domain-containing protein [Ignavibacteria bacterium]
EALLRGKDKPDDKLWIGPARNLYNLLVKPIVNSGLLKKGNNLIISPHNSLYLLPFNALITGDENSFLLFDYNISYVSSSQSIDKNRILKLNSYLGVAPATKDLSYSQDEIINIPESLFKVKKQLLNSSATKNNFLQLAPNYDVIHIASHININTESPLYSSIQFTDQPLKIYEIFKTNIKVKLLILSACESGKAMGMVNDIPTGIDLVNFSRAFREAGVKSVIATKWLVEDLSAYRIVNNFFKIMELNKNSLPVENILTLAQREYLVNAKKLGNKTHPFFWAPFFLIK